MPTESSPENVGAQNPETALPQDPKENLVTVVYTDPEHFGQMEIKLDVNKVDQYLTRNERGRARYFRTVIENKEKFGLDSHTLAQKIAKVGDLEHISGLLSGDLIEDLSVEEIVKIVFESAPADCINSFLAGSKSRLVEALRVLNVKLKPELAYQIIETGGSGVVDNSDVFESLDFWKIYELLSKRKTPYYIVDKMQKFPQIDKSELIKKLIDEGYLKEVINKINPNLTSLNHWGSDTDPYLSGPKWKDIIDALPEEYLAKVKQIEEDLSKKKIKPQFVS